MKKKILFVSHEKSRNGATNSMLTLIENIMDEFSVEVVLPFWGQASNILKRRKISHTVYFYFENYRSVGKKKKVIEALKELFNLVAVFALSVKIMINKYDIVISNSSAVDVGARACDITKTKHIYYVREFMEEDFSFEYRNKRRMKILLENSYKVIFISRAIENKYRTIYKIDDYQVIYNGIDTGQYYIEKNLILNKPQLQIVQVGTISDGKGAFESVKYIEQLCKNVECHLTLVGKGSEKYICMLNKYVEEKKLSENISILPYSEKLNDLFKRNDIILMNSKSEGFGRVTVEGMLAGLLVIGKNSGGTKEIVTDGENGLLFNNEDEFISKVIDVIGNREKYRMIAKNGQDYAKKRFSPDLNAREVMEFIQMP